LSSFISLTPSQQPTKGPTRQLFLFSPLSPPTPPTDPILPFSPAPWHVGPSPAPAAAQASLLLPPVMAILPPQAPRVGGRQSPSRAWSRCGRASIPFVVGMAVVEGGRPQGRREQWRSLVRRRPRPEGAMAEPRPLPPSGGGSHGGAPSAADRIEDRRMRRSRPPSLLVADPVCGAPLLAGRERPADPVPPSGTC
jgi:hypothetical protein